ncbi:MAG: TIGR03619 family F420-dependent LLM class oxidoreductase [Microthrixaceae bacterium]
MSRSAARPTLTLGLPTFGSVPGGDWRRLLEVARIAEDAGVDRLVVTDHVVNGPNVGAYPWGTFPTGPDGDWLEPLTVLAALAAATERVRLSTGILIAPLRPAALLAKTVATLDVLSGGRIDLGVGTGWQPEEFAALDVDYRDRGRLLTDTIGACRALWEDLPATFASHTVSFEDTYCAPRPIQARLPVWFSGSLTERNVRRIVELGDGWIPIMGSTVADIERGARRLRDELAATGRAPDDLEVQGALAVVRDGDGRPDLAATMTAAAALVEAGVTNLSTHLKGLDPGLDDPAAACAGLVEAFRALH